ncbi:MAG: hypothetical protein WA977_00500 [Halobacteriota archaeon]
MRSGVGAAVAFCGAEQRSARSGMECRVAPRSPPCSFFFCKCICKLQLILRSCGSGVVGVEAECRTLFEISEFAPKPNFSRSTPQPTTQIFSSFFYTCILQGAIDFAELRKRSCAAWQALHLSPNF